MSSIPPHDFHQWQRLIFFQEGLKMNTINTSTNKNSNHHHNKKNTSRKRGCPRAPIFLCRHKVRRLQQKGNKMRASHRSDGPKASNTSCQWIFQVPVKGGIGGVVHPPIGRKNATYYTTYSPCLLGGYIIPTTFYGNQKQPLKLQMRYTP